MQGGLTTGGALWFPDLSSPDSTWILPVCLGLTNLLIVEVSLLHRSINCRPIISSVHFCILQPPWTKQITPYVNHPVNHPYTKKYHSCSFLSTPQTYTHMELSMYWKLKLYLVKINGSKYSSIVAEPLKMCYINQVLRITTNIKAYFFKFKNICLKIVIGIYPWIIQLS